MLFPARAGLLSPTYSNPLYRVVVLDKVTDLLLFFGKLLVVGGVGKDQGRELQGQRTGALDSLSRPQTVIVTSRSLP